MSSTTIQDILLDAQRNNIAVAKSKESLDWFMKKARATQITDSALIREFDKKQQRNVTQLMIGRMYMFFYDPKHKETLPYYDTFPCIWMIEKYKDGFLGLNMHYLPYALRARLMDALLNLENKATVQKNKKLIITYSILKSVVKSKLFAPCVKRYLAPHIRSKLICLDYEEWRVAAFLPVHKFVKANVTKVWADSRKQING